MRIFCSPTARALAGAFLLASVGIARAEPTDVELWLERAGPEMTLRLSERIERDASSALTPMVVRRLLAASRTAAASQAPPPASPALALEVGPVPVRRSSSETSCVVQTASSMACVVRPAR